MLETLAVAQMELVCQGQQKGNQSRLILRVDGQHVLTDALGRVRLIEQPITLRLVEGRRDRVRRDTFQLEHGCTLRKELATRTTPPEGSQQWLRRNTGR